jgi:hypothetical protein
MKTKHILAAGAAAAGCMALCGCNGGASSSPFASVPNATQQLDTAAVLAIVVSQTSEPASPFVVDNGAVAVPADDTGQPLSFNGA